MTELLEAYSPNVAIERLMDQAHRAILTSENQMVGQIQVEYTKAMRKLIRDLEQVNAVFMGGKEPTYSQWKQLQLDVQSAKVIAEDLGQFRGAMIEHLGKDLRDMYRLSYNTAEWALDQVTPEFVDPKYNLPTDRALSLVFSEPWKGQRFSDRIWAITDEWALKIQNELTHSIMTGASTREMATAIRNYVGVPADERLIARPRASAQLYRANLIARTELIRAARMAQDQSYQDNDDIIADKEWSAKYGLGGVCHVCRAKNGKTPKQILEMGLTLEEHPNGRCAWIPKVKSWSELLDQRIKDIKATPGTIPQELRNLRPAKFEYFSEWKGKYLMPEEAA